MRISKSKSNEISREDLEEAISAFLKKGGTVEKYEYQEPDGKNKVFSDSTSHLRFIDEEVSLDGLPEL